MRKKLWEENDLIIADSKFTIDNWLEPLKVKLNIPLFLSG